MEGLFINLNTWKQIFRQFILLMRMFVNEFLTLKYNNLMILGLLGPVYACRVLRLQLVT